MMSADQDLENDQSVTLCEPLSQRQISTLIANTKLETLQFSEPLEPGAWETLNGEFFNHRPDVLLRVFGFYSLVCDLSFMSLMTNVHRFAADCLHEATGVEHLVAMTRLESLGIGIYNLQDFNFLTGLPETLQYLSLGSTKSKKPDLAPLTRFRDLQTLFLDGHQKNIEVIATLTALRGLTLRSISTPTLNYLMPLKGMRSLHIKLGGCRDLSALEGMQNIEYLELWQIRGLSSIDALSSMTGLQSLFLESLRHINALPSLLKLVKLRRIILAGMSGLRDVSALKYAPALEEFVSGSEVGTEPEDYLPVLQNKALKRVWGGFGSDWKNIKFKAMVLENGIEFSPLGPFLFV